MAQSVERILGKDEVPSSILGISTIKLKASLKREAFLHLSVFLYPLTFPIPAPPPLLAADTVYLLT